MAVPIRDMKASTVADALWSVLKDSGIPQTILSLTIYEFIV